MDKQNNDGQLWDWNEVELLDVESEIPVVEFPELDFGESQHHEYPTLL
jgi:hypothetical protein